MKRLKLVPGAWCWLLGAWCLVLGAGTADACTGMYAGKGVTADGSVLIGRKVDFSPYNATMYQQICEAVELLASAVASNGHAGAEIYMVAGSLGLRQLQDVLGTSRLGAVRLSGKVV